MRALLWFPFAALALSATRTEAQAYACLPASDSLAIVSKDYVVGVVSAADTGAANDRALFNLPATAANKVSVVSSGSTCNLAGAAFHSSVTPPGTPSVSRTQLVVVKVGTTRFIVWDYSDATGPPTVVFDKNWVKLTAWSN
jgi:hypothetical protein